MKITKQGAKTIKTLIVLVVVTLMASQFLPWQVLLFLSPALMLALIFLLPVLHKYRKSPDFNFFGNLCFAAILSIAFMLIQPYIGDLGYISYGIFALVYILVALSTERVIGSDIDAISMTIIFLVLVRILSPENITIGSIPGFLATAAFLDLSRGKFPLAIRGLVAGLLWSVCLLGFTNQNVIEISVAITYSTASGLVASSFFSIFHLDDEKHIEKLLKKW